ncbi:HK97 gp10 family phage protein [Pseudomonas aeruginosa]|nr:HK97 gp10 family phage protein [Pseudomonas aeruginosa]
MADGVEFSITGMDSLLGKLESVSRDLRYKGGRSALRRAAKLIETEAKKNALQIDSPETANQIAKNISVRWSPRLFKRTGNLGFRIGVLGGARKYSNTRENVRSGRAGKTYKVGGSKSNPGGDTWYWRFIEFGRGPVRVIKRKRKRAPQYWLMLILANSSDKKSKL